MTRRPPPGGPSGSSGRVRRNVWTIPNALSVFRILAAPGLVLLAASDRRSEVVALFAAMAVSDWIDGKIAVRFDQRSEIGPWLDSLADGVMYAALLIAVVLLDAERLRSEWPWVVAPITLYLVAGVYSVAKFRRWPVHHTRMAKLSWGAMLVGAIAFLAPWSPWPLRGALLGGALASLQSMMITRVLPEWRSDVPSVSAARAIRGDRR